MLEQIVIALAASIVGALLLYTFRVKQLYVVIPRLFSVSILSTDGKIVELRTFNRGRFPEEDVLIALDPSLKYEIIASSDSTCVFEKSSIKIPRIPPYDDFSVLLLVEGGEFSKDRLSTISSKTTKGKLISGIENIPPNAGKALLMVITLLVVMAAPLAGVDYYYDMKKTAEKEMAADRLARLDYLVKDGWSNLEQYSASAFRDEYSKGEFPIHQTKIERKGDIVEIQFRIVNEAAAELQISVFSESPYSANDPAPWENRDVFSHKVGPRDANNLTLKFFYPRAISGTATIEFRLLTGTDGFITMTKQVVIDI